jgi:Family of unknown function (DUF6232)
MTTFYLGPYARVTHKVFEVRGPVKRSYAVCDLRRKYIVRTALRNHRGAVRICSGGTSGVAIAVLATNRGTPNWPTLAGVLVVLLASAVVLGTSAPGRSRPFELWALHRGETVCLFRSTDRRMATEVGWALRQAIRHRGVP